MKRFMLRRVSQAFLTVILISAVVPLVAWSSPPAWGWDAKPWKFAITDDSRAAGGAAAKHNGVSTVVLGAIANDIATQGVDFVLFPGDLVTGETDDSSALSSQLDTWKATMAPVYGAGIPVYVTRGNHEYNPGPHGAANPADPSRQTFLAHFPELPQNGPLGEVGLTWSFTHKDVKVVGFDQYANRTASYDDSLYAPGANHAQAMNPWVIDEIRSSTASVNFVIAHEQIWPTDSHPDCFANDPDSRDALVQALATHNGAYLAGHDHMYVRGFMTHDEGTKAAAFTIGTAGGGNYNHNFFDVVAAGYTGHYRNAGQKSISNGASPTFGYLVVTVNPDGTWNAEFRGFQFKKWDDPSDVSLTPISVMDSFTSSSLKQ